MVPPPLTAASRRARLVEAAGSTVTLIIILIGLPAALIRWRGFPLPSSWPTTRAWVAFVEDPLRPVFVTWMIATVFWILWMAMVITVVMQVVVAIARIRMPRILLLAPFQSLSAALIGAVSIATPAMAAAIASQGSLPQASLGAPASVTNPTTTLAFSISDSAAGRTGGLSSPDSAQRQVTILAGGQRYTVTVARGDTLSHLAQEWLGDHRRWPEIYHLNRGRSFPDVGGRFTNADLIYPGWVLYLPDDAVPPPGTAQPNPGVPPSSGDNPSTTPATPEPGAASPSDTSPPASAEPDRVIDEPVAGASAPSSEPTDPTGSPTDQALSPHPRSRGVDLPGGWVTLPLAVALVTTASLVWLHRRRRWIPASPDPEGDDGDLCPLPPVITTLRRKVRSPTPPPSPVARRPHPPSVGVTPVTGFDQNPVPPPQAAPPSAETAEPIEQIPPDGLGLTGPGAAGTARALLVAALSTNDPDNAGQVLIPRDTLTDLLGPAVPTIPRVTVAADLHHALTYVEEQLIERRRTLLDHDVEDLQGLQATGPYHPPMPPMLLLADTPAASVHARLAGTLRLGHPLRIHAALLGTWPHGDTVRVDADGHDSTGVRRLSVLDMATTLDLLGVLREAHTGRPPTEPAPTTPAAASAIPGAQRTSSPTGPEIITVSSPKAATTHEPTGISAPPQATSPTRKPAQRATPGEARICGGVDPTTKACVRVLGTPMILDAEGGPVPGLRMHARQLLVYLVVHRSGAGCETICTTFWPNANPRRASACLYTEVSDLRKHLRDVGCANPPVINPGGRYYLNPDAVTADAWQLVDFLKQAHDASDAEAKIAALRRAVDLHTGDLSEGYDYDWIEAPRERMRRRGIRARVNLAHLISPTDPHQAAELLQTAAALDPYSEDLACRAMRALADVSNVDAVRHRLDALRTALHSIDTEPTAETLTLATGLIRRLTDTAGRNAGISRRPNNG